MKSTPLETKGWNILAVAKLAQHPLLNAYWESVSEDHWMPLLSWFNRDEDLTRAALAPYRLLEPVSEHSYGDPDSSNLLVKGTTLRPLRPCCLTTLVKLSAFTPILRLIRGRLLMTMTTTWSTPFGCQ